MKALDDFFITKYTKEHVLHNRAGVFYLAHPLYQAVLVLNEKNLSEITRFKAGDFPTSVALNLNSQCNHLYVSNYFDNTVSIFDLENPLTPKMLTEVFVGLYPHNLVINKKGSHFLVNDSFQRAIAAIDLSSFTVTLIKDDASQKSHQEDHFI